MYAPAHVATALAVKRRFPLAPLFWLMMATQAIEFVWIVLSYLGIEYQRVDARGILHLDYLPYSHSLLTGFGSAILAYIVIRWGFKRPTLALAIGLALVSHIIYDIVQHEPDIPTTCATRCLHAQIVGVADGCGAWPRCGIF